jgi:hypothetical protein
VHPDIAVPWKISLARFLVNCIPKLPVPPKIPVDRLYTTAVHERDTDPLDNLIGTRVGFAVRCSNRQPLPIAGIPFFSNFVKPKAFWNSFVCTGTPKPSLPSPTIFCPMYARLPRVCSSPHAARLQVDVPVYVLGDTLCQASASKHFQILHTNPLSKFVYPEQGKHELLQEVTMWKVATRCSHNRVCVLI